MNRKDPRYVDVGADVTCRVAGARLPIMGCVDRWADADSHKAKDSPCYRCHQGERLRRLVARSVGYFDVGSVG